MTTTARYKKIQQVRRGPYHLFNQVVSPSFSCFFFQHGPCML